VDLAAVGSLVLTGDDETNGAKLLSLGTGANMGAVNFGNASINGGADGWQAVGADTKITFAIVTDAKGPTITGTGTTPKLVGVGAATGAITVGGASSAEANLTVTNAEIDLTEGGSVVINYTGTASTLTLAHGNGDGTTLGKLTFNSGLATEASMTPANRAKVYQAADTSKANAGTTATSVTAIVVMGATDGNGADAKSIAGAADTNAAVITGQTTSNAVTLDNTAKFGTA
jgi:hypothetical protein